jgi:hypothetical protein
MTLLHYSVWALGFLNDSLSVRTIILIDSCWNLLYPVLDEQLSSRLLLGQFVAQSLNEPSANFRILPLYTNVTLGASCLWQSPGPDRLDADAAERDGIVAPVLELSNDAFGLVGLVAL